MSNSSDSAIVADDDDVLDDQENGVEEEQDDADDEDTILWEENTNFQVGDAPAVLLEKAAVCGSAAAVLETANNDILWWFCDRYVDMETLIVRKSLVTDELGVSYFDAPSDELYSIFKHWIKDAWVKMYQQIKKAKNGDRKDIKPESADRAFHKFRTELFEAIVGYREWHTKRADTAGDRPDFDTCQVLGAVRTKRHLIKANRIVASAKSKVSQTAKNNEKKLLLLERENAKLKSHMVMITGNTTQIIDQLKAAAVLRENLEVILSIINPVFNKQLEAIADSIEGVLAGAEAAAAKAIEAAGAAKEAKVAAETSSDKAQATAFRASSETITTDVLENEATAAAEAADEVRALATKVTATTKVSTFSIDWNRLLKLINDRFQRFH